jgi:GNAT superfamily N-acetyltransferase
VQVSCYSPKQPGWEAYIHHLKANKQATWVLDTGDRPLSEKIIFLGIEQDRAVAASLTLKLQPLVAPDSDWAAGMEKVITGEEGKALSETYVQTFCVDESYRRRGLGELLQLEGLAVTRELGAYQMRSWSSLDKPANYQLKLKLGFAAHPAITETDSGLKVSGVFFVKTVKTD